MSLSTERLSTAQAISIFTSKNAPRLPRGSVSNLSNCTEHASIDAAVRYAEANVCTVIVSQKGTIIWSGEPKRARQFFNA